MSSISIRIDGVKSLSGSVSKCTSNLITVRMGVASLRYSIDSRILSRRNIRARINSAGSSLSNLEAKLQKLALFVNNSMDGYCLAESNVNNKAMSIGLQEKQYMGNNWDAFGPLVTNSAKDKPFKTSKTAKEASEDTGYAGNLLDIGLAMSSIRKAVGSKFKIVRDGDYYIIKGAEAFRKDVAKIPGTRYRVGSPLANSTLGKYINPDISFKALSKNVGTAVKGSLTGTLKNAFVFEKGLNAKSVTGNIGRGLGYAAVAFDVVGGISKNIENGETEATKYAADATVDLAKGLGAMAIATAGMQVGAAIGTAIPIPVVGTVVGAVAGFAIGFVGAKLYNYVVDDLKINGKSVADYAKDGTKYVLDKAVDVGKDVCNGAANMAKDVSAKVATNLEEAKSKVGNFFSGAGKTLGGIFG